MSNEWLDFCKKKKINLIDVVKLIELLEVQEITLVGNEGLKLAIIDYIKSKGIKVIVKSRYNKSRLHV